MKGSMLLSLITLCVVMLLVADRISLFLHGPEPAPAAVQTSSTPGFDWAALWQGLSSLFQGQSGTGDQHSESPEPVVITEDTLYKAWVWTGAGGELRSTATDPGNGMARQVLIPRGVTVEEFFAPVAAVSAPEPQTPDAASSAEAKGDDPASSRPGPGELTRLSGSLADGDAMTPEERSRFLREGMRLFREHQRELRSDR